jgi:hypothetical protein
MQFTLNIQFNFICLIIENILFIVEDGDWKGPNPIYQLNIQFIILNKKLIIQKQLNYLLMILFLKKLILHQILFQIKKEEIED